MRLLRELLRRFRPAEGRATLVALVIVALSAALGAMSAEWVPGDEMLWHVSLAGLFLGRWFAGRKTLPWRAALCTAGFGAVYVTASITRLAAPLLSIGLAAAEAEWPLVELWRQEILSRLGMLGTELCLWIGSWLGQSTVPGSVVSLFWMALILWCGAAFAGWCVRRQRHALLSCAPLGAALALSVFLSERGMGELTLMLAGAVFMIPMLSLSRQRDAWRANSVPYPELLGQDTLVVALVAATVFALCATVVPELRLSAVAEWFWNLSQGPQQASGEMLERAFPGARPPRARSYAPVSGGAVLPSDHLLGGSPELQSTVVMEVRTDDPAPLAEELGVGISSGAGTVYWRGTAYGKYVGTGWEIGRTRLGVVAAYASLQPAEHLARRPLRQEFLLKVPHGQTLYAAGEPSSVNKAVKARRMRESRDLVAIEGPMDTYQVVSMVPNAAVEQMQEVEGQYPPTLAWEYTALPDELPQRVASLAAAVTQDRDSAYERAAAIESYLRQIPYDLTIDKPPSSADVVDYFLFELQRGYCDYFASAMVVMARAIGIPARLAAGYAMGQYDQGLGAYVVTAREAHAWPELYFPGFGWIPFEPTPAFEPIARDPALDLRGRAQGAPLGLPQRSWWARLRVTARSGWLRIYGWLGLTLAASAIFWGLRRAWQWWRPGLDASQRVAWSYGQVRHMCQRLGMTVSLADTPAEFDLAVAKHLTGLRPRWGCLRQLVARALSATVVGVHAIVTTYQVLSYAPQTPALATLARVAQQGRWLPARLWVLSVLTAKA